MIGEDVFSVDPWSVPEHRLDLDMLAHTESVFALSNGHIGLRGNLDEGEPHGIPGTYLNGVYELRPLPMAESQYGTPESSQTLIDVTNGKLLRLLVDDEPRLSCLTLAASIANRRVDTVESLGQGGQLSAVQIGFHEKLGSQCGYCTPGMIMAALGLLGQNPDPSEAAIIAGMQGNICRCGTYARIVRAIQQAAVALRALPRGAQ